MQTNATFNVSPLLTFVLIFLSAIFFNLLSRGGCVVRAFLACLISETIKRPEIQCLRELPEKALELSHIFVKASPRASG